MARHKKTSSRRLVLLRSRPIKERFTAALERIFGIEAKRVAVPAGGVSLETAFANHCAERPLLYVSRYVRAKRLEESQAKPRAPKTVRARVTRRARARAAAKQ